MYYIENAITSEQIKTLKDWFYSMDTANYKISGHINQTTHHSVYIEKENVHYSMFETFINNNFKQPDGIVIAFKRQISPLPVHSDYVVLSDKEYKCAFSIVIPLETSSYAKTIIFKETNNTNDNIYNLNEKKIKIFKKISFKNNVREQENIEHLLDTEYNLYKCDYLTLDGIVPYIAGNAVIFNSNQLHCSNNWVALTENKHKEFIYMQLLYCNEIDGLPLN